MATATVTLSAIKSGYVKEVMPNTTYITDPTTEYSITKDSSINDKTKNYLYFGFDSFSSNLKYNRLLGISFTFYCVCKYAKYSTAARPDYPYNFDQETLTYNTKPDTYKYGGSRIVVSGNENTWQNRASVYPSSWTQAQKSEDASNFLRYRNISLNDYSGYPGDVIYGEWFFKTVLANGATSPYVTVSYDDAETVKSKIAIGSRITGSINPTIAQTVTWNLVRDDTQDWYCAAIVWEQDNAVFFYREQGASSWTQLTISGNTQQVTIPANTFATGKSYEYYVQATDVLGNTSNTATYTFSTPTTQITPTNSPTSGYVNPRNAVSFSWYYNSVIGVFASGDTTLHWRVSGASNWTNVNAVSGADSLTIAANTFPTASTIQWYLSGTDATGYASESSVYSFSTAAGTITSNIISPVSTIESNNAVIPLRWSFTSSDGYPPSRYIVRYRLTTAAEWTTLIDSTTIATSYDAPAYTFPAGEIQWSVLAYNIDDVVGTSGEATFICYGAPEDPVVYADNKPFTTIAWQAQGQQAYEIMIGDKAYGPYFGDEKEFVVPEMLEDGQYTVKVRIVGTYNLWSGWGSTIIIVENVAGDEVTLSAEADTDVMLTWETESESNEFLIYRDNVLVGKTNQNTFVDRLTQGEHEYYVINKLDSGYYTKSNEVTAETSIGAMKIALASGGEWIQIDYTLADQGDPSYEETAQTVYNHLAGDTMPSVVLSLYQDTNVTLSAVFLYTQKEEQKKFEAMFGKPIILKLKDGSVIVGVLDTWSKQARKQYWTGYTFTIRCTNWEDFVDDTQ